MRPTNVLFGQRLEDTVNDIQIERVRLSDGALNEAYVCSRLYVHGIERSLILGNKNPGIWQAGVLQGVFQLACFALHEMLNSIGNRVFRGASNGCVFQC